MTQQLISFLEALFQESREDPTDPEPLYLTKKIALREYFNGPVTIRDFCQLFNLEFDYFQLSPKDFIVYYSFRVRPETPKPFNDRYL